jgi:predicted transposase/invertase (TIGR01784 family)
MDLRVDYAFKLLFALQNPRRLVLLLNAIFENKGLPRVVNDLAIANPGLEKEDKSDKFSVIDIIARLSDKSMVLIEMHLYGLIAFAAKSVRSWAKVFGRQLKEGQEYTERQPVIAISFIDGKVTDADGKPVDKIHSFFQITERDTHQVLTNDMELHFIDMRAFAEAINGKAQTGETAEPMAPMLKKWLALITQAEINDKSIIQQYAEEEADIMEAVAELLRTNEDFYTRYAYERRLDQIAAYNLMKRQAEEATMALRSLVDSLSQDGKTLSEIAAQINMSEDEIRRIIE